ncbi:hypothetical protein BX616_000316 [Lobosporangium transversale]|nr:hypothetical protein BX616_000316 [Lobosporangium transversale]
MVNALPDESYFSISKIAQVNGGHEILKAPPYHCELQPTEKIWAVIRQMIFDEEETIENFDDIILIDSGEWDMGLLRMVSQEQAEAVTLGPEIVVDLMPDTRSMFDMVEDSESEDVPLINRKRSRKN